MTFGNAPFYYYTMRKINLALGALLNGIQLIKYGANGENLGMVTIDVTEAGKDQWYSRLFADPNLTLGVDIQLPSIAYEFKGIQYDPTRKLTPYVKNYVVQNANTATSYIAAFPYNMNFEVNLAVRTVDDGFQVMEQILPFFDPQYVVALKYLSGTSNTGTEYVTDEVPFILEGVRFENNFEGPAGTSRAVIWTLDITAKALFFGPTPEVGVIKEVIINLRNPNANAPNQNIFSTITNSVDPLDANISDSWTIQTTVVESPNTFSGNT